MKEYKKTILKKGREIPLIAGHPWLFSGGIENPDKSLETGDFTDIYSAESSYTATATWHKSNSIKARVISTAKGEIFDTDFFIKRFKSLSENKKRWLPDGTDCFRLVHSDADMLPGLVIDAYDRNYVIQINTKAMDNLKNFIIEALVSLFAPDSIIERSDVESRKMDMLDVLAPAVLYGKSSGRAAIMENYTAMIADMLEGQKTGFFLDQRDARIFIKSVAAGRKVLNLFSYTGGFSVSAAAGGAASVTSVDVSQRALDIAAEIFNLNRNIIPGSVKKEFVADNVFDYLSYSGGKKKIGKYEIIICDPPAFARKRESTGEAVKAYTRLNRMCLEAAETGTIFLSSSCSGMIGWSDFYGILKNAAGQAGKKCSVIREFTQAHDHTRKIAFPEGSYLKTLVIEVTG